MLQQSANIYESFFDNSLEGIIIFDDKGKIINANTMAGKLFGLKRNDLTQGSINEIIGEKYHPVLWEICSALITGNTAKHDKTLVIPDFGKKKTVLNIYLNNHIRSASGPLIAAIIRDETQRFKDKEEVKQAHERFKKTFHNNPVAQFIVCTNNGKIIDANNRFLELMAYHKEEVIGGDIAALGISACDSRKTERPPVHRGNPNNECEKTIKIKNNNEISVLQSYNTIELNGVPHELWTIIDLTAQKAAEKRLLLLNDQLEQKVTERTQDVTSLLEREKVTNDLKSRFVAMASHEFRTQLTTVLVSAGLLESYIRLNEPDKCFKHIARIKSSVNLLTEILEDFLSLDKIEQTKVEPHVSVSDLDDFAERVVSEIEASLRKGQRIIYTITGATTVKQDINILKNVMLNLLSNASKYSKEDQKIKWDMVVAPDRLTITVSDSGIGIPDADQPHIFSRFFRAMNAEVIPGTGLGLHIVKKYLELLHGSVSFASIENEGTTFTVVVPLLH